MRNQFNNSQSAASQTSAVGTSDQTEEVFPFITYFQDQIINIGADDGFTVNKGNLIIQNVQRTSAGKDLVFIKNMNEWKITTVFSLKPHSISFVRGLPLIFYFQS